MLNPTTRPVSRTSTTALLAKAHAWIEANGRPHRDLVEQAIRHSELAGDPFVDNPFRRALLQVDAELTYSQPRV